MDESTPPTPPRAPRIVPLDYAPGESRLRRRLIKWSVVVTVLVSFSMIGYRYGPHAWLFARQWYWQQQCMNFNAPADLVVYGPLPDGAAAVVPSYMDGASPDVAALLQPLSRGGFGAAPPTNPPGVISRVPICWVRFLDATRNVPSAGSGKAAGVVFCHDRVSPAGHRRLVTVEYPAIQMFSPDGGAIWLDREGFSAQVYGPAGWNGCRQLQAAPATAWLAEYPYRLPTPSRFYAGQPDPADASHFSMEYEWSDGVHGFVDGWLNDDDTIMLKIRPGQGAAPR